MAATAALWVGTISPRRFLSPAAGIVIDSASLVESMVPSRAKSPTIAYWAINSAAGRDVPAADGWKAEKSDLNFRRSHELAFPPTAYCDQ